MSAQCKIHATHSYPDERKHDDADRQADEAVAEAQARATDSVEDADQWLDEIDAVLEENALEFVNAYVQKPGQ